MVSVSGQIFVLKIRIINIYFKQPKGAWLYAMHLLYNMDFSLFKTITQRVSVLNNNPPAMRVETICYTKKSPIRYNIVVQATIVRKDGDFNG